MRRRALVAVALVAPLLAGCAPYMRTDMPTPRAPGLRDALASLVGACGTPRPGAAAPGDAAPDRGTGGPDAERGGRRCDAADDAADGTTPTPAGPTQKKP